MRLSQPYILAITALALLLAESLYAAPLEYGPTAGYNYRLSPALVIDLREIFARSPSLKRRVRASLLEQKRHSRNNLVSATGSPRFTLDLTNIDLLRLKGTNQLIRYIRSDSGEHAISIIDQNRKDSATSMIVHDRFIGIGITERSRHFILGKESSDGDVAYSAKWGYRF